MPAKPVVLFDLDGVLLNGDAFTQVVLRALIRRPWRILPAAVLVVCRLLLPRHGRGRRTTNEVLVRLALHGLDQPGYARLAESTGSGLGRGRSANIALIEEARRHRNAGCRVVVVTASERRVARWFLDTVGLDDVELVGSELAFPRRRSALISRYNLGQEKVVALRELGVDLAACQLYTDSAADLPLMRTVAAVILVDPSLATRRAVERAELRRPVTLRART